MTPRKQTIPHRPEDGLYGDCHRAALASILDLPVLDVPHFMHGLRDDQGEEFEERQRQFLSHLGLWPICIPFNMTLEDLLLTFSIQCPNVYYLLGGIGGRGASGHTVVGCGGEIVHDPHLSDCGLSGPMKDGYYWVTFISSTVAV